MKIGIVNYSLGNVGSVLSAIEFYKYDVSIVNKPEELEEVDVIVLAGVGNFKTAVSRIREYRFWDKLIHEVIIKKKPVLGICLGMLLFADVSYEDGENKGFGWIKGEVLEISGNSLRIPHIGWDEVKPSGDKIFKGMLNNFFYFMHSYHFIPEDKNVVIATTKCGDIEMVSSLKKDNIVGVQFHPEKSQGDGLRLIRNFLETMM